MRKNLLAALFFLSAIFLLGSGARAQGTLIHYWHFNNYTTTYTYPHTFPLPPIDADFSIHDTSKARIYFTTFPGTSPTWHSTSATIMDPVATVPADADTVNLRMGVLGLNGIRPRNQLDSAYLLFYIPTNNYQNIRLSYGSESSSVGSGDTYQLFDYSVDSGVTWQTSGLSQLQDSAWLVFHRTSITFSNSLVNNNPGLVFRIHFIGHNNGTSGNNRFDNVAVDGDSIIAPVPIHYWHFNNYTSTYTYPHAFPIGPIDADISVMDTSKARIYLTTFPGTSPTWHSTSATIMDPVATVPADADTVNLRFGVLGLNGLRPRNQLDSAYLLFYIPSTGYHDVIFSYGSESSSVASGDTYQVFDYSVDSGITWRTTGLSKLQDSAWLVFHRTTVTFTSDSAANNNPGLVFRIHFVGHNNGTSGNNRFDNVSLDGIPYPVNNTITTTAASYGPFCNASANAVSVAYSSVGTYTGTWSVQLSNPGGTFPANTTSNIIGTGTTSTISASIPSATAAGTYRVRVINTNPAIFGTDNGSDIIVNGPPAAFNVTGSASYCAGGTGVAIGLSGSQNNIRYKLYLGGTNLNDSLAGTGGAISFGNMTAGGTYTVEATNTVTPTCTSNMTGSAVVTVNPIPSAITGNNVICAGGSEILDDAMTGGTWASSFIPVAVINSTTGELSALSAGLSTITYTLPGGCYTTTNVLVNGAVPDITGMASVCTGSTTNLFDGSGGGTFASSDASLATIDPFDGTVTGVAAGSPVISYTTSIGCITTTVITVNQTPSVITGPSELCVGSTVSLGNSFTGGTWVSSDGSVTIDLNFGTATGFAPGNPTITYTLPAGCTVTTTITVNPLPAAIEGTPAVCVGSVTTLTDDGFGSWSSSNTSMATVDGSGNVSGAFAGTPTITYMLPTGCQITTVVTVNPLPSGITGINNVCEGLSVTLSDATSGGSWSSSSTTNATIDPSSGMLTGIVAGTSSIVYTLSNGCTTQYAVVVNPMPSTIAGNPNACVGQVNPLTDVVTGGTWISGNSNATIGLTTGSLRGVTPGSSVITYTLPTGCSTTTSVTINALSPISGLTAICSGLASTLADATSGGSWSSDNTAAVSIDPVSGSFNSVGPGISNITYTLSTGCVATSVVTVSLSPSAITGDSSFCIGASALLTDGGGGLWRSSNSSIASIGITSGDILGLTPGVAVISYTLGSGCVTNKTITVNPSPATITGVLSVCQGATTFLSDASFGGTWVSTSGTGAATVDASSGAVTGVTAGNASVTYTLPTGCKATKNVTVNPLPAAITGIAHLCVGATSMLGDATAGGAWTSSSTSLATVNPVTGNVSGVSAGNPVISYISPSGCFVTSITTINPLPTVYTVTGGGSYCSGSGGLHVGLSGSATGIAYQLFYGVTLVGSPVAGTGSSLDFGLQTLAETYTVTADNGITGCHTSMAGNAPVVTNSLPAVYTVTGGGHYCASGTGVHIGLDGSNSGINYQLFNGAATVGTPVGGSAGPVDFGSITGAGTYTVVATNASTTCTNNMVGSAIVTVDTSVTPSVTISTGTGDTVCSGRLLTVTATPTNGGPSPIYSWRVNGVSASVSGGTYRYLPSDGDIISTTLTSSAPCVSLAAVASAPLSVNVLATGNPNIHITAAPGDVVCQGSIIELSSSSSFGGPVPEYSWVVNGIIMGSASSFSYAPTNHDNISCILISDYRCRTSDSGTSNNIVMEVDASTPPVVSISASPNTTIAQGQTLTLTAGVTNGGPSPSYQWYVNGIVVPGANSHIFTGSTFADGDSVVCNVTSNGVCAGLHGSSAVTIHITHVGVSQVITSGSDIRMVPNPNRGVFTVKGTLGSTTDGDVTLVVTDMLGQVVYNRVANVLNGKINELIEMSNTLANGMYLLNVRSGTQNDVFHFVIEK